MNSPTEIAQLCILYGVNKVKRPKLKTFILSIIGGCFLGSGALLSSICSYNYYGGQAQFYEGIVFPIGFVFVYCAGAELFTVNSLLIIPFFTKNITLFEMLLSWLIVFIGNFIGAILLSLLVVYGCHIPNMFEVNLAQIVITTGIEKCSLGFGEALIKGLLCNFYNCLGIWVSLGGKEMRSVILGLWTPIFLFVACRLEHCVANIYYITAGLFASYEYGLDNTILNWGRLFYKNLIPVTIGNMLGGVGLVGFAYSYIYLTEEEQTIPKINKKNCQNINESSSQGNIHNDLCTLNSINNS